MRSNVLSIPALAAVVLVLLIPVARADPQVSACNDAGCPAPASTSTAIPSASGEDDIVPEGITGGLCNTGTLSLTWSGDTAVANAIGWAVCGEPAILTYAWNGGGFGTSNTYAASPGQNVSVTLHVASADYGVLASATASGTAPSSGGPGGPGGGGSVPVVTLTVTSPNPQPAGNTASVAWSATNDPTSCDMTVLPSGYKGAVPVSSTGYSIGSIAVTSTVNVNCSNSVGTSATATQTITVQSSGGGCTSNCDVNLNTPLTTGTVTATYTYEHDGPVLIGSGSTRKLCPAGARWKVRTFHATWPSYGNAIGSYSEDVTYSVCYVPGKAILMAGAYAPANAKGSWFWTIQQTSDNGYPSVGPMTNTLVVLKWQSTIALCVFTKGCGLSRHPGVQITFYTSNTEMISEWVG